MLAAHRRLGAHDRRLGVVALVFQMRMTEGDELKYSQYRNPGMAESPL